MAILHITGTVIFGLLIGSFLSVCIFRIPYGRPSGLEEDNDEADLNKPEAQDPEEKISISDPPRSFCPQCRKQLLWWHNIPVVSWFLLRGKCAFCKATISFRYPLVELLSAFFALACYYKFGLNLGALVIYAFCAALIVISFIDYDYYIIPNVISLPGTVLGIVLALLNQWLGIFHYPLALNLLDSFLGILAGGGFLLIISEGYLRLRKREGLGMGDVKLLAMTGAFFGMEGALYTIFVGSILGSILGLLFILAQGGKLSQQLPFGPYLAMGTILYIFFGPDLVAAIVRIFV